MSRQGDYREALSRIAKARDEKSAELNLSKLQLTELPIELFECTYLRELDISFNQLTSLPSEIGSLDNLRELNVSDNQLASLPSEIGNLGNLQQLDVSDNQLTSLPNKIGNLANLQQLDVSDNQLTSLPNEIGSLGNLQELNVSDNQLISLPSEIGNIGNLQQFYVYFNKLTSLPSEIGNLNNLQELDVFDNQLTSLPNEIGNLDILQQLDVSDNQLTSLPSEIGNLDILQELNASGNRLTSLPNEIGNLDNLQQLDVSDNQLTSLPSEIGNLDILQELDVSDNQLTSLPSEIGSLVNLKQLDVSGNQLTSLPSEIGSLDILQELNASGNRLTSLPSEIGSLGNLRQLNVSSNQLLHLPKSLDNLTNLNQLFLHANTSLNIPPDILGPTYDEIILSKALVSKPKDILGYYFRTRKSKQPLNEAKLILVGRGEVGKTSLVSRLIDDTFSQRQRKTDGIKISNWEIELKKKEKVRLNVWDFGGQEIMHATHQFFLTERSLYLLVLDGRGGLEDNDAEYWLKIISSFGADSPVIIVLNKIKTHPFDLNRKALLDKYPFIKAFVKTDCKDRIGIQLLLKEIKNETDALENLRVPFPAAWFAIKERIASMKQNYLTFAEFKEFCQKNGETEDDAQDSLAYYLHQLGIALNYKDDPRLKEKHILNPFWLTQGIYKILNSSLLEVKNGEITENDISKILDKKKYPKEMHCFLLELMKKFELCFQTPKKENSYLIPELLSKQEPSAKDFMPEECLNFQYNYSVLPPGLLPRFIVRTYTLSEGQKRWRSGVILQLDGCKALVRADVAEKKVTINILGPIDKRKNLLAVIRNDFEKIHADIKNLQPDEIVPVPGYSKFTIAYSKLLGLEWNGIEYYNEILDGKLLRINVKELLNGVDFAKQKTGVAKVFISYCHKDENYKNQLETHLKILQRQNIISPWNDRRIIVGENWEPEIDRNLDEADIIILLISADFVASNYCYDIELRRAIERHDKNDAIVIPVFVRKCNWSKAPFRNIQGLPKDAKPVKNFKDKDEAWTEISKAVENIALNIVQKKQRIPSIFVTKKPVKILPSDAVITVELEFDTLLLCTYKIQLREKNSNKVVLSTSGDNSNGEEDKYVIGHANESDGRTVWISFAVINQTGEGGKYEIRALFKQNGKVIDEGILSSGIRAISHGENSHSVSLVALLQTI